MADIPIAIEANPALPNNNVDRNCRLESGFSVLIQSMEPGNLLMRQGSLGMMKTAVILFQCFDQKGILAKITCFLFGVDANIISVDQYTTDSENGRFFLRIAFFFNSQKIAPAELESEFSRVAQYMNAEWSIFYQGNLLKMGILVSKPLHCLVEILNNWKAGDLAVDIPCVISNHEDHRALVEYYGLPFHHLPVTSADKREEDISLTAAHCDFLVLARYMQILSSDFLDQFKKPIINIHHSFLPSFKGADPYRQAFDRGVKVIGATAHYVTPDLDEGPITAQMVSPVSHRDSAESMRRKGKHMEKVTLLEAIQLHIDHRVIPYENKTIVFS